MRLSLAHIELLDFVHTFVFYIGYFFKWFSMYALTTYDIYDITLLTKKIDLTHWGRDEMNNISQTTFSNVFSSTKMFEFRLKFHSSLFPRV